MPDGAIGDGVYDEGGGLGGSDAHECDDVHDDGSGELVPLEDESEKASCDGLAPDQSHDDVV